MTHDDSSPAPPGKPAVLHVHAQQVVARRGLLQQLDGHEYGMAHPHSRRGQYQQPVVMYVTLESYGPWQCFLQL